MRKQFLLSLSLISLFGFVLGASGCAAVKMSLIPEERNFIGKEVWNKEELRMSSKLNTVHGVEIGFKLENIKSFRPLNKFKIVDVRKRKIITEDFENPTFISIEYLIKLQDSKGDIYMQYAPKAAGSPDHPNIPRALAHLNTYFDEKFLFYDPYMKYSSWPIEIWDKIKERKIKFEDYRTHSDWPTEIWDKIEAGELWIGATKEQVACILGDPIETYKEVDTAGVHETNVYIDNIVVVFDDGKLSIWKEKRVENLKVQ